MSEKYLLDKTLFYVHWQVNGSVRNYY